MYIHRRQSKSWFKSVVFDKSKFVISDEIQTSNQPLNISSVSEIEFSFLNLFTELQESWCFHFLP
jgi:hypothetical protein